VIYDWDPDAPPPKGYRLVDSVNGRMLGGGIGLLAGGWLTAVMAASVGSSVEANEDDEGEPDDGTHAGDWTPLYFPVVGPFLSMATLDPDPSGMGLLLADGIVQTGGALAIVLGVVDRKYKVVRYAVGGVELTPLASPGQHGLVATGRF
jgi:hypothetical protein